MISNNYRVAGTHQLNKWLWSQIKELPYKGGYAFEKYASSPAAGPVGLVPFVPSQQLPEFTNIAGGAPFIVYTYSTDRSGNQWFVSEEQVAYVIYDNDEERLRAIHNLMIDLLKRADWTAQEVNDWFRVAAEPGTNADPFDFKTIQVIASNGPQPFETQDGRQGAMVVARLSYTHDLQGNGLRI